MAETVTTTEDDVTQSIREAAYHKWAAAGYPPSDGVEFWLAAEAEIKKDGETKLRTEEE